MNFVGRQLKRAREWRGERHRRRRQLAVTSIVGEQSARCTTSAIATSTSRGPSKRSLPCAVRTLSTTISFQSCCSRRSQSNWSSSEPLLGPAVDQRGQIGENRVTGEILEGHRTVQGDCQLHCRQRRAAQVEEVMPPADLILRDAEHLCPCGCQ